MPSTQAIQAGRAFVRLFLKNDMTSQLVRVLRKAQARLQNFSRSAITMGRQVAIAGALMAAPLALATRTFAQFDDGMREVGAVTQAVGADFDLLTDKAKKLGASTSFTATEVALLMAELGRAGFAPAQIDKMTGSVLALARATKTEAAPAAGIMSAAIRQFALGAGDASRVADVLTAGANKSFNTLESLGESLKFAGPVANDFNMSLEDTVAVLGTLGNVGIQGSAAGTAIRRILLATGADAKKLQGIFGVAFVDAAGNARPLVDTLQDVADATKDLGTAERARKFKDAFGLLGITGASSIAKNITGTRELRDAIGEAGGIAEDTAAKMDAGLGGAFRILKSSIEGVQIAVGEALAPTLQKITKAITKAAQSSIKWIEANKGVVIALAATAAGTIALGVAITGLGVAALVASVALGAVATVVSFIASPLGILVAALAAGTVAWVKYSDSGKRALASLKTAFGTLLGDATTAFDGIKAALESGDIEGAMKIVTATMQLEWSRFVLKIMESTAPLRTWWTETTNWISDTFKTMTEGMDDDWFDFADGFKTSWNFLQDTLSEMITLGIRFSRPDATMASFVNDFFNVPSAVDLTRSAGTGGAGNLSTSVNDPGVVAAKAAVAANKKLLDDLAFAADDRAIAAFRAAEKARWLGYAKLVADGAAGDGVAGSSGPKSAAATSVASAIPTGVALTATYSAAAASISGFQAGGAEEKMANGITGINDNTTQMLTKMGELVADMSNLVAGNVSLQAVGERFLAGWKVT